MSASESTHACSGLDAIALPQAPAHRAPAGGARPLSAMQPGETGTVVGLCPRTAKDLQKLLALGVLPGAGVALLRRSPSYIFEVGFSLFAVDQRMAEAVLVRPT